AKRRANAAPKPGPTPTISATSLAMFAPFLEFGGGGPEIQLLRPGAAMLAMKSEEGLRYVVGRHLGNGQRLIARSIDRPVHQNMSAVNSLRTHLSRHRLREGAQPELRRGESGKTNSRLDRWRGTGEEDGAPAPQHGARRCAADQESTKAGHAP